MTGQTHEPGQAWALAATSLGYAVVQLDVSVVNVAIKPIGTKLGGDVGALQWVVNAYTVAFAALILTAGALSDRFGAKRLFTIGFSVFTGASVLCGMAPSIGALIAARAVQGVGAAVLVPCSLSLLNHAYPDARARARAVGLWAAGASVALSAGPLVGGVLIAWLGWRWIFLINVPLGAAAIGLTIRYATETTQSRERGIDLPALSVAIVGLVALTAATVDAGRSGFTHPLVLAGFGLAAAATIGFVLVEARGSRGGDPRPRAQPMLPLTLFRSRTFSAMSMIGLIVNIAFYGLIFVLSLYFQTTLHYSPLATGLAFAPATAAVLVANLVAGRLTARFGTRPVIAAAAVLMAVSLAGLLLTAAAAYLPMTVGLAGLGFGIGTIVPAMTAALLGSVETSRSGVASGTLNSARQTGSALGVALFGSLAAAGLTTGLRLALIISIAIAGLIAVLAPIADPEPGWAGARRQERARSTAS